MQVLYELFVFALIHMNSLFKTKLPVEKIDEKDDHSLTIIRANDLQCILPGVPVHLLKAVVVPRRSAMFKALGM